MINGIVEINRLHVLMLCISVTLISVAQAQVKKWVDKDGKVHYGDAVSAPTKSSDVKINDARGSFNTEVKLPRTENPNASQTKKDVADEAEAKFGLSAAAIKSCIQCGKKLSVRPSNMAESPEETEKHLAIGAAIKKSCPGVQIRCKFSSNQPETNQCEAFKAEGDNIVYKGLIDDFRRQVQIK